MVLVANAPDGATLGVIVNRPSEQSLAAILPGNPALARFTELENGSPAIEILMQVKARPGMGMELWLSAEDGTVARWSGGSTAVYVGTVCFQLELQREGEAVPLGSGKHTATLVFREPVEGVVAARQVGVTNQTPHLTGTTPSEGSSVFSTAWACRRGQ